MNKQDILKAANFRFACKEFNGKKIPKDDLDIILEAGRLAPSAYGLEHTRLIIVQNDCVKKKIQELSYNQKQVSTASEVVIFVGLTGALRSPNYADKMIRRKVGKDEQAYKAYSSALSSTLKSLDDRELSSWSFKQSYLMAQAMMDAAAMLGIDSCPMEGFDKKKLESYLQIDSFKEEIALIIPFGYRLGKQPQKLRLPLEEIVRFM